MKNRLNFIIIPISLLGLFAVVSGIREEAEDSLLPRLQGGIERVQLAAAWTEDARAAVESFAATPSPLDREGRFEVLDVSATLLANARPWRAGTYVCEPPRAPHPTDRWRASVYFAQTEIGGRLVRYSLPFEPYFLRILNYYIAGMILSLLLAYGVYGLLSFVARALARRMADLIAVAGSLPAKIERGEEPDWPRLDILDLCILEDEFRAVAHELHATFGELTASRDALESAVKERTRELESMSAEIRLLLARLEKEREGERMRVARELHDEFGQGITGLGMALHILERRQGNLDERDKEKFTDMRTAIADLTERMRHLIADLRPSVLDRLGLSEALERLAIERGGPEGPEIEYFSSLPQDFSPSEEIKIAIFRIAQEAVTNAIKYSFSKKIRMSLESVEGTIILQVADSGKGFDLDSVKAGQDRTAFGIIGMRERCHALGGAFSLRSAPRAGTLVQASFPSRKREE
jgi:signal transduction histidine kinase